MLRRLLFVDDEPAIRLTLKAILSKHGFHVTTAATVAEGLQKITSEKFDVLISDLNIGNPGDGLTVVSAMRRTQPDAVTMILTGYPAFETALEAIRQQVDDYIVKPASIPTLINAIESKLADPTQARQMPPPKRVSMVLRENLAHIEEMWLASLAEHEELSAVSTPKQQRSKHLHAVLDEIIRVGQSSAVVEAPRSCAVPNSRAVDHKFDGYTPHMILSEFCLLRCVIAQVVQENLLAVNLSYVVPDLARVNDSIDEQAQSALAAISNRVDASI